MGPGYFTYQLLQDFFHQPCHFDFFQGTTQEGSPSTLLHRCPSQWWWTETPKKIIPIFCRDIMGEIQNPTNTLTFYRMFLFFVGKTYKHRDVCRETWAWIPENFIHHIAPSTKDQSYVTCFFWSLSILSTLKKVRCLEAWLVVYFFKLWNKHEPT